MHFSFPSTIRDFAFWSVGDSPLLRLKSNTVVSSKHRTGTEGSFRIFQFTLLGLLIGHRHLISSHPTPHIAAGTAPGRQVRPPAASGCSLPFPSDRRAAPLSSLCLQELLAQRGLSHRAVGSAPSPPPPSAPGSSGHGIFRSAQPAPSGESSALQPQPVLTHGLTPAPTAALPQPASPPCLPS